MRAVHLDHQLLGCEQDIDLHPIGGSGHVYVGLEARSFMAAQDGDHVVFETRSSRLRAVGDLGPHSADASAAGTRGVDLGLEGDDVDQLPGERFMHDPPERSLGVHRAGKVEGRTRRRGDGYPFMDRRGGLGKLVDAMNTDLPLLPGSPRHGDIDRDRSSGPAIPQRGGREVAEHRVIAEREHRGEENAFP